MRCSARAFRAPVLLCLSVLLAAPAGAVTHDEILAWLKQYADAPAGGLAPGHYGQARLPDLAPYLAPGFRDEFDFPYLDIELTASAHYLPHSSYRRATAAFANQPALAPDGALTDYRAGQPFSAAQIAAADPVKAGYMVAWDHIYRWQYYGYNSEITLSYIDPPTRSTAARRNEGVGGEGDVFRHLTMYYHRVYLSRLAMLPDHDYRMNVGDSNSLYWKEYVEFLDPFDVAGTKFIVERPLDPKLEDQVNSYLSSERRVRRLSSKERADSWMGSNFTLDDFEAFSGRVMDSTWTYLGRKVVLHVTASKHEKPEFYGRDSNIPDDRWQLRRCYVVEAKPVWEGHPYGRRLLFFDEDTLNTVLQLVFDRNDELWKVFYTVYRRDPGSDDPDGDPAPTVPMWRGSIGIDVKNHTTTIARGSTPGDHAEITASRVKTIFNVSNLTAGRR